MKISWQNTALIPETSFATYQSGLAPYTERLKELWRGGGYEAPEASLNLPFDGAIVKSVKEAAQTLATSELSHVVIIGIGGSNLGARAVYDALQGFTDPLSPRKRPKALFLETLDGEYLKACVELLHSCSTSREFAIVIASKSGTTTETIANAALLFQELSGKFTDIFARTAVISDEGTPLARVGREQGSVVLTIPKSVGGRYSVFSPVGLLPLTLLGIDVDALVRGAAELTSAALEGTDTGALESAVALAYHHDSGRHIHDMFLFSPRLESLGKWYRQLLAESIGKERSIGATTARVGLTPTVSIGTMDLHSVAQLYLGGPRDKVTTFVNVTAEASAVQIHPSPLAEIASQVGMRTMPELLTAVLTGVKEAYRANELPFLEVELAGAVEHELGAFMQHAMLQTMYLGKLLNVNAFDQPAVEEYKKRIAAY